MKILKDTLVLNDMDYELVKRTATVAMYAVKSRNTGRIVAYEAWNIPVDKERTITKKDTTYTIEAGERMVSNTEFGIKYNSKCFNKYELIEAHYNQLVANEATRPV